MAAAAAETSPELSSAGGARPSPGSRGWRGPALAVAALALFAAALYWPARACGLVSDSWHLLYIASAPLGEAVTTRMGYHFIPGTHLLNALLWRGFGLRDPLYQWVNLGELVLVAAGLYWVGRRLLRAEIAFIGALFFLANASFYEVPLWTGVGNFQSLAALLYLAGVLAAFEAGRSEQRVLWSVLLGILGLAAFFTYEPALSILPVGALVAMHAKGMDTRSGWRPLLRGVGAPLVASAVSTVLILVVKARLAAAGDPAMFLPTSLDTIRQRLFWAERAVLSVFSLRAAEPVVSRLFSLGTKSSYGEPGFHALLAFWLVAMAGLGAWLLWKGPSALRVVALWFAVHIGLLSVATVPQSRHFFLAALPASLLAAAILWELGAWLFRRTPGRVLAPPLVALTALVLLLPGAKRDLDAAVRLYAGATAASRQTRDLVDQRLREPPALASVTLVNFPATVVENGVHAYSFLNGTQFMIELGTRGRISHRQVRMITTHGARAGGRFANGTVPVSLPELEARVHDRSTVVLLFEPRSRTVLRLSPIEWQLPSAYTPATAPYLPWEDGTGLPLAPGEPLGLMLPRDQGREWVAVRFLRTPTSTLSLAGEGQRLAIPVKPVTSNYWSTALLPLPAGGGRFAGALEGAPGTRLAGVWSLIPPRAYSPRTAPFLSWWLWGDEFLNLEEAVTLPLDIQGCEEGCELRIEYSAAPARRFSLAIGNGAPRAFPEAGTTGGWAQATLPLPSQGTVAELRVVPAGDEAVWLRAVERVARR